MSLYEVGLRAKVVPCFASPKCKGEPFIQDKIVFVETKKYKKGCHACGGVGAQVIFEPPIDNPMKFTEKDVRFYNDRKAQRSYQGKKYVPVLPTRDAVLQDRYRFHVPCAD